MNNSKLDFIQSVYEQQQKAEQLQMSLQQLSDRLINFEKLIEQSEQPIINGTTLLHKVQEKTTALELHLNSILTEIGNSIPPSNKNADSQLYRANRGTPGKTREYRYYGNIKSEIEHRFVSISTQALQSKINNQLQNISIDQKSIQAQSPGPSTASDSQSKWADRERNTNADHGKTEYAKSKIHFMRDDLVWSADDFNQFLY